MKLHKVLIICSSHYLRDVLIVMMFGCTVLTMFLSAISNNTNTAIIPCLFAAIQPHSKYHTHPQNKIKKHSSSLNKLHWDEDRARCWLACVRRKTEICSGVYAASRKCGPVRCGCGRLLHIVPNITHRNTILVIWYTHVVNCLCCWRRATIETVLNGSKCVFSACVCRRLCL